MEESDMAIEKVTQYFESYGLLDRIVEFDVSCATVEKAAEAIGCKAERIAKSMTFLQGEKPVMIIAAGDMKIDNKKYKDQFQQKSKMIPYEIVETYIGHAPGGVCPFAVNEDVEIFMDISLKRFDTVFPAAGSSNSVVKLSVQELELFSKNKSWVDVCK